MKNTWKKWMAVTCAMMMTICPLAVTAASAEEDTVVTVETLKLATPTDLQPVAVPEETAEEPAEEIAEETVGQPAEETEEEPAEGPTEEEAAEEAITEEETENVASSENETELVDIEEYETPLGIASEEEAQIFTADDILSKEDLPDTAVLLAEILDEMNEERSIEIYISYEGEEVHFGDTVTLYAVLKGYENCEFTVQWQQSKDNQNYEDIAGQNGLSYTFEVTEDNYTDCWRLAVIITAVEVPDEMISDLT